MNKIKFIIYCLLILTVVVTLIFIIKPLYEAQFNDISALMANRSSGLDQAKEKEFQEVLKLRIDNIKQIGFWQILPNYFSFITLVIAVVSALIAVLKYLSEQQKEREERRKELEEENQQRQRIIEERRNAYRLQIENKLEKIQQQLASRNTKIRASAAVSIISLINPRYQEFLDQIYFILLTNLKLAGENVHRSHQDMITTKYLIMAFEKALRRKLQYGLTKEREIWLNLAHCSLERIDLSNLDLSGADIAFANLTGANLSNSKLIRVRGFAANLRQARISACRLDEARLQQADGTGADFSNSRLVSCDLKDAILTNARFHQAQLQGAHLNGAVLYGARFEQANINDAYFRQCSFDNTAKKSLVKARNWHDKSFQYKNKTYLFQKYDPALYKELLTY